VEQQNLPIDAARAGHRPSQAVLLRELQDPWYRFCLGLLNDPDRARDAVQETALRFLKALAGFRGEARLTTWSMGIALNVVREMRRSGGRAQQDDGTIADARPAPGETPDALAEVGEQRARVRAVLDLLPERQREVVMCRYFEEMSVEETAKAMGCAEGTVKATLFQALRSLKAKLG
jgi:RNA polymerase sigma-70 factor, ECF subfamily